MIPDTLSLLEAEQLVALGQALRPEPDVVVTADARYAWSERTARYGHSALGADSYPFTPDSGTSPLRL
jgi:hypothetical protein